MTLVHLYRKYKAWNPVHPSFGAFWGFGVGLGCGVGWGPGFGPECIGYVGSGCGIGLSVGVTLVGFGVGLPAEGFAALPWNSALYTAREGYARRGAGLRAALRAWDSCAEVASLACQSPTGVHLLNTAHSWQAQAAQAGARAVHSLVLFKQQALAGAFTVPRPIGIPAQKELVEQARKGLGQVVAALQSIQPRLQGPPWP